MGIEIAPARPDQYVDLIATFGMAFGFDADNESQNERFKEMCEWDRTRVAYDGPDMVGTSGAFSLEMTVPGATMACGGTTIVSVVPTHRRRGILRAMMDQHLDDVREREEPIAALWASDSAIYGRFGYGCAATGVDIEIDRTHVGFHRLAPDPAPVRVVGAEEAASLLPPVYDSVRPTIPGYFARSEAWWRNRRLVDDPDSRDGATRFRYAITEVDGHATGYVQYRVKEQWSDGHGAGTVRIRELLGTDPASWSGLWRYVLSHDLVAKITASLRSTDEPLLEMLAARRRATLQPSDTLWVRVMDPKAALEGRRYEAIADVVVDLHDPLDGTVTAWHLDLSPEGATVEPSQQTATVALDVEDLSACFMGWSRFGTLQAAGRVTGSDEDVAALDRAFGWSPGPWCPEVF